MLLVAALATACTDGHSPPSAAPPSTLAPVTIAPTASPTSSPSPSPSEPLTTGPNVRPGEKPPEYPALARRHTAQGALAFAAYYYEAFDWGYATNDPYLVSKLSERGCVGCRRYMNGLRSLRASGGVLRGGRLGIVERGLRYGRFNYQSDYVARVVVNEGRIVITRPSKPRRTVEPPLHNYVQYVFISWLGDGWKVVEVAGE